jgi:hypothetical protein
VVVTLAIETLNLFCTRLDRAEDAPCPSASGCRAGAARAEDPDHHGRLAGVRRSVRPPARPCPRTARAGRPPAPPYSPLHVARLHVW